MSTPALQRTARRGIALVLIQLGAISAQLYDLQQGAETIATFITLPLVAGALVYLIGSVGYRALTVADSSADSTA